MHVVRKSHKFGLVVLACLALVGVGLYLMTKASPALIMASASAKWPATQGHITKSTIEESSSRDSDAGPCWKFVVRYSYTVDNQTYEGGCVYPGEGFYSRDRAWGFADRYRAESIHAVYYLPSAPATACLEPGIYPRSFFKLLLGSFFVSFGAVYFTFSYLMPKYGKLKAKGKTYTLRSSHPLSKAMSVAFLLLGLQFAVLMYFSYQGYVVK